MPEGIHRTVTGELVQVRHTAEDRYMLTYPDGRVTIL